MTKEQFLVELAERIAEIMPARVRVLASGMKVVDVGPYQIQVGTKEGCICRPQFSLIDVSELSDDECHKLNLDVCEIKDKELGGGSSPGQFQAAEKILLERIGGQVAVKAYVECLMAMPERVSLGRMALGRPS